MTKWLRDELFEDLLDQEKAGGEDAYQAMMREAERIPAGSDGLITLPYFAGERTPVNDPDARGMFFGGRLEEYKESAYRSIALDQLKKQFVVFGDDNFEQRKKKKEQLMFLYVALVFFVLFLIIVIFLR